MAPSKSYQGRRGGGRSGRGRGSSGGGNFAGSNKENRGGGGPVGPEGLRSVAADAARKRLYSECSEDHCVVCLNRAEIFAVGRCNHTVCNECSTRYISTY